MYLTLQAADNLAFEARRVLFNEIKNPHLPERVALTRMKTESDGTLSLYKFDYDALKRVADLQVSSPGQMPEMEPAITAPLWELGNTFYEFQSRDGK
jgi:hypothetical protein